MGRRQRLSGRRSAVSNLREPDLIMTHVAIIDATDAARGPLRRHLRVGFDRWYPQVRMRAGRGLQVLRRDVRP